MAHPAFIIEKTKDGQFRFNLTAKNGQVILSSESYTSKWGCLNGVESVKKNATKDSQYEMKQAKNGQFFFNLRSSNNQVIGTSEMHSSADARLYTMERVRLYAPVAEVDDRTVSRAKPKKNRATKQLTGVVTLVSKPKDTALTSSETFWVRVRVASVISKMPTLGLGRVKILVVDDVTEAGSFVDLTPEDIFIEKPE